MIADVFLETNMELKYGEIYNWDDIVKKYPDKWLFMTDVDKNNGVIGKFKFLAICSHDKKASFMRKFRDEGISYECERTTFAAPNMGVLC